MINKKFIKVFILALLMILAVFIFSNNLLAFDGASDLSFVDTEIHDIYYLIARANNLDIFIMDSVEGRVTVQINDIYEKNILEDFIHANGDSFILLDQVYYIGNGVEINLLKDIINEVEVKEVELETAILKYNDSWSERWGALLDRYYPDLKWGYNEQMGELILKGEKSEIDNAYNFMSLIIMNREGNEESYKSEMVFIPDNIDLDITDIIKNIEQLEYNWLEIDSILYLSGEEMILNKTVNFINDYIENNKVLDRIRYLNYIDSKEVEAKISLVIPESNINSFGDNKLVLSGTETEIDRIEGIIDQIDLKPQQVLVEFNVLEINDDIRTGDHLSDDLKISLGYNLSDGFDFDLNWTKFLNYAEEQGEMKSLASPSLLTLVNKRSRLHIGDRVPVPKYDADNNISGYEYIDTGIILDIVARVNSNQEITLEIEPEISNFISYYNNIPTINTRELSTNIRLNHGETYYIAGLKQFRQQEIIKENNLLSNLPLLGWLFSNKYYEESTGQLILAITPYLILN